VRAPDGVSIEKVRCGPSSARTVPTNAASLSSPAGVDHSRLVGHHVQEAGASRVTQDVSLSLLEAVAGATGAGDAEPLEGILKPVDFHAFVRNSVAVVRGVVGPLANGAVSQNPTNTVMAQSGMRKNTPHRSTESARTSGCRQ
jgi:hypothetical protein